MLVHELLMPRLVFADLTVRRFALRGFPLLDLARFFHAHAPRSRWPLSTSRPPACASTPSSLHGPYVRERTSRWCSCDGVCDSPTCSLSATLARCTLALMCVLMICDDVCTDVINTVAFACYLIVKRKSSLFVYVAESSCIYTSPHVPFPCSNT